MKATSSNNQSHSGADHARSQHCRDRRAQVKGHGRGLMLRSEKAQELFAATQVQGYSEGFHELGSAWD